MTSSKGNLFHVTGPLCGEFTGPGEIPAQRPVTRSFDVFLDLHPNKRLSKQPWGWWFETPSWSLWRQCNAKKVWRPCQVCFLWHRNNKMSDHYGVMVRLQRAFEIIPFQFIRVSKPSCDTLKWYFFLYINKKFEVVWLRKQTAVEVNHTATLSK